MLLTKNIKQVVFDYTLSIYFMTDRQLQLNLYKFIACYLFRPCWKASIRQLKTHVYVFTYTHTHIRIPMRLILILQNFPFAPNVPKHNLNIIHLLCFNILIYSLDIYYSSA